MNAFQYQTVRYKKKAIELLMRFPDVRASQVLLFGSFARNDWVSTSDIDIAIKWHVQPSQRLLDEIYQKWEESIIPFKLDLVPLDQVSKDFKKVIEEEGIVLCKEKIG